VWLTVVLYLLSNIVVVYVCFKIKVPDCTMSAIASIAQVNHQLCFMHALMSLPSPARQQLQIFTSSAHWA
jgi:hypothetical protein